MKLALLPFQALRQLILHQSRSTRGGVKKAADQNTPSGDSNKVLLPLTLSSSDGLQRAQQTPQIIFELEAFAEFNSPSCASTFGAHSRTPALEIQNFRKQFRCNIPWRFLAANLRPIFCDFPSLWKSSPPSLQISTHNMAGLFCTISG